MKKKLIVIVMILSMAISQSGVAWGIGEGLEKTDQQVNVALTANEKPDQINIIRPLGEIVTDENLFISAKIFDGAKAKLSVFKKVNPIGFSAGLNSIKDDKLPYYSEELIYESPVIERIEESVFYFEETTGIPVELSSDSAIKEDDSEPSTEELLMADKLGKIFGATESSDIKKLDKDATGDVLFYYKNIENIKPGHYRIRFDVLDEYGDTEYFVEKQIEVKEFSLTAKGADEIKKEVFEILSKSFTGIMSR